MNRIEIIISRVKACINRKAAWDYITELVMARKISKREQILLLEISRLSHPAIDE